MIIEIGEFDRDMGRLWSHNSGREKGRSFLPPALASRGAQGAHSHLFPTSVRRLAQGLNLNYYDQ